VANDKQTTGLEDARGFAREGRGLRQTLEHVVRVEHINAAIAERKFSLEAIGFSSSMQSGAPNHLGFIPVE
jgi:hypothetical protein